MDRELIDDKPREEWELLINRWVHDEQARRMLVRHLLDGITYEALAEELDISRATVFRKVDKYSKQLFKHSD